MENKANAEEEDRRRIAREIHDDFSQRAAALSLILSSLKKRLPHEDALLQELEVLCRSARELGDDLRRFSHDLHPANLDRGGLPAALREHCEEVGRRHQLEVELELSGDFERLPQEIALALFRVVQEGLANAARHAQAQRVKVRLQRARGGVTLTLSDDGRGFELAAARRGSGLGLAGISERAEMFGGRCRILARPGSGTEIGLWIPLPEPLSPWGQLRALLRRHRGAVFATLLVILALSVGIVATWQQAARAREETLRADATVDFLEQLFAAANPRSNHGRVPDARELLRRGSERLSQDLLDHPLERARLLEVLGGIETELAFYAEARPHLEEALALRRQERGDLHLDVAASLFRLGKLAQLSGVGDAVAYFREALAIREAQPDRQASEVFAASLDLGVALAVQGELDEAEKYLRRALAVAEQAWGENDPRVAKAMHNLGGLALRRQENDECDRLLGRALAIREKTLPPDDPDLLESLEAVAVVRLSQQRGQEAAVLLERLLPQTEKIYGADHPNYVRVLQNLAMARKFTGRPAEAKEMLQRALAIGEKKLPPDHKLLAKIRRNLADL